MLINCSPAVENRNESRDTLKFGERAKAIKCKWVPNIEKSIEEYRLENADLQSENSQLRQHI